MVQTVEFINLFICRLWTDRSRHTARPLCDQHHYIFGFSIELLFFMLFIFNFCFLLHFGTRSLLHVSFLSLNFDSVQHNHTIFVLLLVNYIKLIFTILLIEKNDQMKLKTSFGRYTLNCFGSTEGEHCGIPPVHVFCNYIYVTPMLHLSLAPYTYHPIATITDQAPLHQVTD